jgi:HAE1 family hydrophobic/amphiphilic exporter-1
MTLFLMPTMYYVINKRSDERAARAEARRERIASGEGRFKKSKEIATAASTIAMITETEGDL